jgi:hypothetical protein
MKLFVQVSQILDSKASEGTAPLSDQIEIASLGDKKTALDALAAKKENEALFSGKWKAIIHECHHDDGGQCKQLDFDKAVVTQTTRAADIASLSDTVAIIKNNQEKIARETKVSIDAIPFQ